MSKAHKRDHYATLGLPPRADARAIKTAYRELLKTCHPDVRPDDAAALKRFREITDAYTVLCGPVSRRLHDAELSFSRHRQRHLAVYGVIIATASCVATVLALGALQPVSPGGAPSASGQAGSQNAARLSQSPGAVARSTVPITADDLSGRPAWLGVAVPDAGPATHAVTETAAEVLPSPPAGAVVPAETATPEIVIRSRPDDAPGEQPSSPAPPAPATSTAGERPILLPRVAEAGPPAAAREASDAGYAPASGKTRPASGSIGGAPWKLYRDSTSGFALRYPAGLLTSVGAAPHSGDRLLRSADGRTVVRTYSGRWTTSRSVTEFRRMLMSERYVGAHIDFVTQSRDRLLVGGTIGSEAFREIALFSCSPGSAQGFVMVYPIADADRHETLFDEMSKSLIRDRPSPFRCNGERASGGS